MTFRALLLGTALLIPTATFAATPPTTPPELARRVQLLEDRVELKALVDTFSNLADRKAIAEQVLLFTPDATVESVVDGKVSSSLQGREAIAAAFGAYLAQFDTVYHLNGQQTVAIDGDRATGTSYCLVVLIGMHEGQRTKETSGVRYADEYVRQDGRWLIAKRTSTFLWRTEEGAARG